MTRPLNERQRSVWRTPVHVPGHCCEQAAPLHGRKIRTTDDFRSHGASPCMQVVAFVNLKTEYGQ